MQEQIRPLDRNRLSVLMAALLLGCVLFRFIELPEQTWHLQMLGSPLDIHISGNWLLVTLMVGLVCTGANLILHDHPHLGRHPGRPVYITWILPGIVAGLSAYFLSGVQAWPLWIVGLLLTGVSVSLVISAEYIAISPEDERYPTARLALNALAYLLAFILFAAVYQTRGRSLVTASLTLLAATLLALDLLSAADAPFRRVLLFSAVVGLIVGQSTWILNYWQIRSWAGGLFLTLIFYAVVNIVHQYLLERLSAPVLAELAIVSVIVIGVILLKIF